MPNPSIPRYQNPLGGAKCAGVYSSAVRYSESDARKLSFVCVSPTGTREESPLTLDTILTELKAERDRLNQAIAVLEGTTAARHRRKKARNTEKPRRRRMSAAARKHLSEAKRKWWAERKKKAKGA